MPSTLQIDLPPDLAAEFEQKYFWWEAVGSRPRSNARIVAQAMEFGSYADILRLERSIGQSSLAELMRQAEPGWLSARSWEFWRGRLSHQAGETIPERPPQRALNAENT